MDKEGLPQIGFRFKNILEFFDSSQNKIPENIEEGLVRSAKSKGGGGQQQRRMEAMRKSIGIR
jgi:hypothetical protein